MPAKRPKKGVAKTVLPKSTHHAAQDRAESEINATRKHADELALLEELKQMILAKIKDESITLKVGDLLKILEIQRQLAEDERAEEKFWDIIEQIRREELDEK